jgi:hypothetical protein
MAKASDILNKAGSGGIGHGLTKPLAAPTQKILDADGKPHAEAHKEAHEQGSAGHKPAKAMGGGGGASIRPKV